jgi:hypothetical protein
MYGYLSFYPVRIQRIVANDVLEMKETVGIDTCETNTNSLTIASNNFTLDIYTKIGTSRIKWQPKSTGCALVKHYSKFKQATSNAQIADLVDPKNPVANR